MSLLRLLNVQGIAGLAVSAVLATLLAVQAFEVRHWKKQSDAFEKLYLRERAASAVTTANYRAAADLARANDLSNKQRVEADQRAISERTANDYQTRIAAARASAGRLRGHTAGSAADFGAGRAAAVPAISASPRGTAQGAGQNGLPQPDRLIATEQAIQLDELIRWVRAQAAVEPDSKTKQ